MNALKAVVAITLASCLSIPAFAQTKDPELNKCIAQATQVEEQTTALAAKLPEAKKKVVSDRRIRAVNAYQAIRPRTLQSCRTYLGTIGTIKMDIENKRI